MATTKTMVKNNQNITHLKKSIKIYLGDLLVTKLPQRYIITRARGEIDEYPQQTDWIEAMSHDVAKLGCPVTVVIRVFEDYEYFDVCASVCFYTDNPEDVAVARLHGIEELWTGPSE